MVRDRLPRRKVLINIGAGAVAGLAGCSDTPQEESDGEDGDGGGMTDTDTEAMTQEDTETPSAGDPVAVEIITPPRDNDPVSFEATKMLQSEMEKLGISVTLNTMTFNSAVDVVITNRNYDIWSIGWSGSPERLDPSFWFNTVYHSSSISEGGYNSMQYNNPEFDEIADEQINVYDYEERKSLVDEGQQILLDNPPAMPYVSQDIVEPYNSDIITQFGPDMAGQGVKGFWNMLNMEISRDDNILRIGQSDTLESQNPLDARTTFNRQTFRLIYDRLFRIGPDLSTDPWVAESMEQVDDTTIRVSIADREYQFHDGEPMTIEDIKFSYDYQKEHSPIISTFIEQLDQTEIIDDRTLEFNLAEPSAPFLTNGLTFPFILPKHIWEDIPDSVDAETPIDWNSPDLIGSGPFRFEENTRGEELRLSANPDHWAAPNIDGLINITGPQQSLFNLLETGELDAASIATNWSLSSINRLEGIDNIETLQNSTWGFQDFDFNCLNTPKADPSRERPTSFLAVRRAIHHVCPKQRVLDDLLGGRGTVEHSMIVSGNERWHNSDLDEVGLSFTGHEVARQELQDAGFIWDDDDNLRFPS
ncbi:MAG: ABC transporter substrate-binding protein [Halobacteriales archaeon]